MVSINVPQLSFAKISRGQLVASLFTVACAQLLHPW